MKSAGKDLEKAHSQAKDYAFHLSDEELPEYIMVSDFKRIRLYNQITGQEWKINLKDLHKKVRLFSALAGYKATTQLPANKEVDIKAAGKMAQLHDILKNHGYDGHELEVYLVRLLFCLFADDTGIFEQNIFFDYINQSKVDGSDLSFRLAKLFEVLDTPPEEREKQVLLSEDLKRFAYVNGSLFKEKLKLADFDIHMRKILLECASLDWGFISPAIFGSIFQGVMNPEQRRELGAHYTSEENILKLIKPLFLDELWAEFERIRGNSKQLALFHQKLAELKFLELGCGWRSLSLYMAKEFPTAQIVAVSNSATQKAYIDAQAKERHLENLTVITEDINTFDLSEKFHRVVSVEMFEHMRNYEKLMEKVSKWLLPKGLLFVHIFTHEKTPYSYEVRSDNDWMTKYFFSGGTMPSQDLLHYFAKGFSLENQWALSGKHYQKTLEAWLQKMDEKKEILLPRMEKDMGKEAALKWWVYWRVFFMASAEFFGYKDGQEWYVSHYLFERND